MVTPVNLGLQAQETNCNASRWLKHETMKRYLIFAALDPFLGRLHFARIGRPALPPAFLPSPVRPIDRLAAHQLQLSALRNTIRKQHQVRTRESCAWHQ